MNHRRQPCQGEQIVGDTVRVVSGGTPAGAPVPAPAPEHQQCQGGENRRHDQGEDAKERLGGGATRPENQDVFQDSVDEDQGGRRRAGQSVQRQQPVLGNPGGRRAGTGS